MKKILLTIITVICIVTVLTACAGSNGATTSTTESPTTEEVTSAESTTEETTSEKTTTEETTTEETTEAVVAEEYVFVVGFNRGSSDSNEVVHQATVIWMDGTKETIDIKLSSTGQGVGNATDDLINDNIGEGSPAINAWFTCKTTADGTTILLNLVDNTGESDISQNGYNIRVVNINSENPEMRRSDEGNVIGNDDTVYIATGISNDVEGCAIGDVLGVTTGIQNTNILSTITTGDDQYNFDVSPRTILSTNRDSQNTNTYVLYNKNEGVIIAAVVVGEPQ